MSKQLYIESIIQKKRERVAKNAFDLALLMEQVKEVKERPSFYEALAKEGLSIIGEVKKASPSKGLIKPDFNPLEIAKEYETCVDAVSVLTEQDYFLGDDEYLKQISESIKLPTLCKDFIIDEVQIYRAKLLGASAVLLIAAILSDEELIRFLDIVKSLGMDALVEVHTHEELIRVLSTKARIIGINNRDLKNFETSLEVTKLLRTHIPEDIIVVSESGIHGEEDIKLLSESKVNGVLIGECFMRTDNIQKLAEAFKNAYKG